MGDLWHDVASLTFSELAQAVEEHPSENTILEYKDVHTLDAPTGRQKLVQDLTAFANTFGGTLVLGVEGKDGSYRLEGLPRESHKPNVLRDQVVNLALDMSWPPLLVDAVEVESDGGQVAVVVKIANRLEGPTFFHSEKHTGCFSCSIRAHGRRYTPKSSPEGVRHWTTDIDLATDLPELQGRADKAAAVAQGMRDGGADRLVTWLRHSLAESRFSAWDGHNRFTLSVCPRFPREPVLDRSRLLGQVQEWRSGFPSYFGGWFDDSRTFTRVEPMGGGARLASIERCSPGRLSGVATRAHWLYVEATDMGLLYLSLGIPGYGWPSGTKPYDQHGVDGEVLVAVVGRLLGLTESLYADCAYPGPLSVAWDLGPTADATTLAGLSTQYATQATWHREAGVPFASGERFWGAARKEVDEALVDLAWTFRAAPDALPKLSAWTALHLNCE
jgi:hypothetical protein